VFMDAFSLNIAKYIASLAATVDGEVDAILLTGGTAYSKAVTDAISKRVGFIAPVEVHPGEHELESLAEHGYAILAKEVEIRHYNKDASSN